MYMFVILSPCAFLAADYILLGRIVEYLDAARYLLLPPGKVSWTFVISDSESAAPQALPSRMSMRSCFACSALRAPLALHG